MSKRLGRFLVFVVVLAAVVAGPACNKNKNNEAGSQGFTSPPGIGGGPGGLRGPIREAMTKLFKGPQSLKDSIGRELKSDSPAWEALQPQAQEFAQLAASLSQYEPPKGSKDSWTKLTAAFSESAAALAHAVQAKNKEDALAAHAALSEAKTCQRCHQAHRGGPGGAMRRPGGFEPPNKN